jgi:hypothetical protein
MDSSSLPLGAATSMRWFRNPLSAVFGRSSKLGPAMIAVGLTLLVANACSPAVPVITGMALIALGATLVVASRFRCSPALPLLVGAHLLVYSTLYLLFVGANFHAAFAKSTGGPGFVQLLDLALSIGPIVAAAWIAIGAIAGGGDAPTR